MSYHIISYYILLYNVLLYSDIIYYIVCTYTYILYYIIFDQLPASRVEWMVIKIIHHARGSGQDNTAAVLSRDVRLCTSTNRFVDNGVDIKHCARARLEP